MRFRWFVVGWTCLAIFGWLVSAAIWGDREAACDDSTALFCFEPEDVALVTGVFVAGIWLVGLVVLAVVAMFAQMWKRLGPQSQGP